MKKVEPHFPFLLKPPGSISLEGLHLDTAYKSMPERQAGHPKELVCNEYYLVSTGHRERD